MSKKSTRGASKRQPTPTRPARPTASVVEYRRALFSVGRCHVKEGGVAVVVGDESWGRTRIIKGGVTGTHRNLIDIIRTVAEHRVIEDGGQEHLIFDSAKVRAMLPPEHKQDWFNMRRALLEVMATIVQIDGDTPGAWGAAFPLATFVGDANSPAARAPHQFKAKLKRLVLSPGFTGLLEKHANITLSRDVLTRLLALENAVSRAVTRWCLSHSTAQHHDIARVLAAIGAIQPGEPISGRAAARQARRYVQQLKDDAAGLLSLGVELDLAKMKLHTRRTRGVFITAPTSTSPVDVNEAVVDVNEAVVDVDEAVSKEYSIKEYGAGA